MPGKPRESSPETKLSVRISREKRNQFKAVANLSDMTVQEYMCALVTREIENARPRLDTLMTH